MSFVVAYALAGAGTLLVVLWVMLYLRYSSQYDVMIAAIDKKQFFLPEIFFIGFGFMDMFKVNLKTEAGRKKEKKIAEIYGEKYAEYYHNCIVGGQITYALTVAPLGLFIGAMTNDMTFAILVVAAAAALIVYLDIEVSSAVERKHDEILSDYPEILSKLTLLVNAGMVIREAWTKVAYTCDRAMYTTCIEKYSSYETVGDWHVQPDRNYVTVSEEGRYGMAAKDGTRKIKCTYEYLGAYDKDTGVIPCCLEGSYYYIDVKGNKKLVGDNTYQYLGSFGDGLAPAQRDGKYGYIDTEFHEQMFELDYAGAFANGVAAVKKGDKWALINCKLKNITDFTYDEILVDSYGYCSLFDRITVRTGDKYFFVDHDGKQIGATYDGAAMVAANDGYAAVKVGSQWGFADAKGELVIQPQYENARSFSLGLAPVEENDRWGYINTDGELVVEEKYFDAGVFSPDGAACVKSVAAWSFLVLCEYDS